MRKSNLNRIRGMVELSLADAVEIEIDEERDIADLHLPRSQSADFA